MSKLIEARISILAQMKDSMNKQSKTSLFKEFKEISLITDDNEERKDLFSLNVYLEALMEFCEIKEKEEDRYEQYHGIGRKILNKTEIQYILLLDIFSEQVVFNYMIENDNFLEEKIKKPLLKKAINYLELSVKDLIRSNEFQHEPLRAVNKNFTIAYMENVEKISRVANDYGLPFYFFNHYAKDISVEDFYIKSFNDYIEVNKDIIERPKIYLSYYEPNLLKYYEQTRGRSGINDLSKIIMMDIKEQNSIQLQHQRERMLKEDFKEIDKQEVKPMRRKI